MASRKGFNPQQIFLYGLRTLTVYLYHTIYVTILRKIRVNSQESFTGKSSENVDSNSKEFLVTLSKEFLVTNSREFLDTKFCRKTGKKCRQNLWKFLGISRESFFKTNSWEQFPKFSQEFPRKNTNFFLLKNHFFKFDFFHVHLRALTF